jgi:hypothetical protein
MIVVKPADQADREVCYLVVAGFIVRKQSRVERDGKDYAVILAENLGEHPETREKGRKDLSVLA